MIQSAVGKGTTTLTKEEFDNLPNLVGYELPNIDMYPDVIQFKGMDMYGHWVLYTVVHVSGNDEAENGVNVLATRIEVEDEKGNITNNPL
jgi:hypothetical protein